VIFAINRRCSGWPITCEAKCRNLDPVPARLAKAAPCHHDEPRSAGRVGTPVTESENIVAETTARIFADLADPQTINRAKNGQWKEPLWRALANAGLTLAWVPKQHAGA
jgi:hypothetical protein